MDIDFSVLQTNKSMKLIRYLLFSVVAVVAVVFVLFSLVPSDEVTERYETYAAANAAGLFRRGWLPGVIPLSSERIIASNDLDLNLSSGEFYFSFNDRNTFLSQLSPTSQKTQKLLEEKKRDLLDQGYKSYEFSQNRSRWVFLVNPTTSHALFVMQYDR